MRLRDYQELINRAIPIIEALSVSTNPVSGYPGMYQISNIQGFLTITAEIKKSNLFLDTINKIDKIANFTNTIENSTMVSQQTKNSLNTIKTDLLVSAKILQQTLKEVLTEEDENVLNIKLPEKYSSISDYIKFFETLKDICLPFKYVGEEVVVVNFDVGSEWLGLNFTGNTLSLFLTLADKGANLFHHVLECQKTFEDLEKAKIDKSTAKLKHIEETINIVKADKAREKQEYIDKLIEEAISESEFILQENTNSNEFKNLLRLSLEKLSMLLIQGIEIVPAIKSKPIIKELSKKTTNNIHAKRKLIIGCDEQKYLTLLDSRINPKELPADTVEMNSDENELI